MDNKHDNWRRADVAEAYDARRFGGRGGARKQTRDEILVARALDGVPGVERVLDLPVGTGRLLGALRAGSRRVVGADRSLEMLRAVPDAAAGNATGLLQADARALPFADDAFDAVVAMRFLFHVADPGDRRAILSELARVARLAVVVQVRDRRNAKQAGRWLRARVGAGARWKPAPSRRDLRAEWEGAGLNPLRFLPVSRAFSDKVLVVARPMRP